MTILVIFNIHIWKTIEEKFREKKIKLFLFLYIFILFIYNVWDRPMYTYVKLNLLNKFNMQFVAFLVFFHLIFFLLVGY